MSDQDSAKEMSVFGKIAGIFASPKETFEAIDVKPTWLIPYLIVVVAVILMQLPVMEIQQADQIAMMQAKGVPAEHIERAEQQMQGPMRFIGLAAIPIVTLIIWSVFSGIFLFTGNTLLGGKGKFKNIFSVFAWTSLIGLVGGLIQTFLVISKGTRHGVTTSLAILMDTPEMGAQPSLLYKLLSKTDIFMIWVLVVWAIGFSVVFKFSQNKSSIMVFSLWAIWIVISIALSSVLGPMFGG